jgi:prevent-host-death family protein
MVKVPYIIPVTDLRQDAAGVIRRLRDSREPIFVTQRGRTAAVVLSPEAYELAVQHRDLLEALARGEREIEAGQGSDLATVMAKAAKLLGGDKS